MTNTPTKRSCTNCSSPISRQSKTGRCKPCALAAINADPEQQAKRIAGIKARFKDPSHRAKMAAVVHAAHMKARRDPDKAARMNNNIHRARLRLNDPDVRATFLAGRPAAIKKRLKTLMAWCPEEYQAEYKRLVRSKRMLAADAKRFILSQLTPFERQMQALRNGARLVEMPVRRSRAHDYTLGGVTDWAA